MQRIPAIDPEQATETARTLLNRIQMQTGMVNNQNKTMAVSPAVLQAYLDFDEALSEGVLSGQVRERIALTVAQTTGCQYSLAVHCALGKLAGLSEEEIQDSRKGVSPDRKLEAIMQFARQIVIKPGQVMDPELTRLGKLGCGHEEIVEIAANAMLAFFRYYFNKIAGTQRDFPKAPDLTIIDADARPLDLHLKHLK